VITEKDLEELLADIIPAPKPVILHCGKGVVREFAKSMYGGGSYNFQQLLGLFRCGFVSSLGDGWYEVRG
jgi:hypothetical protein